MKLMIVATVLGLMAACAVEQSAPSDPSASSDGDQLPAASTSTTEQAIVTPQSCWLPWAGPGNYYFCSATSVWNYELADCNASCSEPCELGAHCNASCACIYY
jgi:hypothetical protein